MQYFNCRKIEKDKYRVQLLFARPLHTGQRCDNLLAIDVIEFSIQHFRNHQLHPEDKFANVARIHI